MTVVPNSPLPFISTGLIWRGIGILALALLLGMIMAPKASPDPVGSQVAQLVPTELAATQSLALETYLKRRAVLLLIRNSFDVVPASQIQVQLSADAEQLKGSGPTAGLADALDRDLLAEGSYYIVALRYLIESDGAAWPQDQPSRVYNQAALIHLEALLDRLFAAIATRSDPLPIFLEAQAIRALTEGYKAIPKNWPRFSERDNLIADVTTTHGPVART